MPHAVFRSREELDAMVEQIDRQLDVLYRASAAASRAEVWNHLAAAALKLAAPEDHEYVYERLHAVFRTHAPATGAPSAA
ncbi:hypothetical protein [Pseudoxanthomonas sp. PXM02]|uniref:hypothetical protein n=1 Tax=Pseudoxanthomonas sp. PXM02 TaxID=2769294 RepID=UPI00178423C8|nr:hypothetical protein [Pseudoxanthomonas sp. PXM02]MBD9480049.1 hypothetical protein [Pseudoxanthomonas sp. PXM02]